VRHVGVQFFKPLHAVVPSTCPIIAVIFRALRNSSISEVGNPVHLVCYASEQLYAASQSAYNLRNSQCPPFMFSAVEFL
jgi:hypothetical protein